MEKTYVAIDLKSFYASVECVERGFDPLTTNLVVADPTRTEKTICLAVSPSLKSYGISGRARLFEAVSQVENANNERKKNAPKKMLIGSSYFSNELDKNPAIAIDFIVAPPRMALYMDYSARIYNIYLKYVSPEDIHVYSVDEVFIDITSYLKLSKMSAHDFTMHMIKDVLSTVGITATAGIGTNMYLAKVAMDIVAKKTKPDADGVRIAELDEKSYRYTLWDHRPLTDFWRVGAGYRKKLEANGMFTMGDIARCSVGNAGSFHNEGLLYKLFGVNAELLIDHAWGYEPCTIADVKAYKPENSSICSGQVLQEPYDAQKARLIVQEMTDLLVLDLVEKGLVTNQLVLTIGYDIDNLTDKEISKKYSGEIVQDRYGRNIPKHSHGTANVETYTSSTKVLTSAILKLYDQIINPALLVRRINITANKVLSETDAKRSVKGEQLNLFTDYGKSEEDRNRKEKEISKEKNVQKAVLGIKKKYGKNAILKGMNFEEGATAKSRNSQIGGHKA